MCGRFTRNYTWEQIHALYRLTAPAAIPNLQPRFNACPTDPADTIVEHDGKREWVEMRWGLDPYWWNKSPKELRLATFNARVETVTTKPFFREPFKKKRCLMPVSGYYEWQDTPGGNQPWYFTARDGSPVLTIAGLWDEWKNRETGDRLKSCAMIIAEPNDFVAEVHDRMPVLLKPEQFEHWLSGDMGVDELKPIDNDYLQLSRLRLDQPARGKYGAMRPADICGPRLSNSRYSHPPPLVALTPATIAARPLAMN
jgi:putative SOS response-associated peptidase YedK